jgi:predicted nucleotidyltransferase
MSDAVVEERALQRVRAMVLEAVRPFDADVWLFGSRARGDATDGSDIDVAVQAPVGAIPGSVMAELRDRLFESHVPWEVDVVDLAEAGPEFRSRVLAEAIPWTD